jgi:deoxyribonuclease V
VVRAEAEFPYIPGFLAFREVPVLLEALALLRRRPDAILVDAQGTAHPRKFGCACHLGVLAGIPTVGCAKNLLCGESSAPAPERGSSSPIILDWEPVGLALRTRTGVREIYVSPGHLADLATSANLALRCSPKYRIPAPIREAHRAVNEARRSCAEVRQDP